MELTEWDSQENSAHTPTYNPHILTLNEINVRISVIQNADIYPLGAERSTERRIFGLLLI